AGCTALTTADAKTVPTSTVWSNLAHAPNSPTTLRWTETVFDHAEVGGLVRVAELSDQAIFTREDRDDAAVDAAALAHPLVHDRLSLGVVNVGWQQEFLGQDHGGAFRQCVGWIHRAYARVWGISQKRRLGGIVAPSPSPLRRPGKD